MRILIPVLLLFGLIILLALLGSTPAASPNQIKYGVTFSPQYAGYLKLDWQNTYLDLLDRLKVRNLRLPSYWDVLESQPGKYNFSQTDFLIKEAGKRGAKIILVVGARQPRWPECHVPAWAQKLSLEDRRQKILDLAQQIITRYQNSTQIWAWQVENEPFLSFFGQGCDPADKNFLTKEVDLVKSLSNKPIIMTDSGELGFWVIPMQLSDVFGTTLYRRVYDKNLGYFTFPIPAYFYNIKSAVARIFAPSNKKTIIIELQAEPWLQQLFTVKDFKANIEFSQKTGFDQVYLWGAEWWYYMAEQGHPEYLDYAKTLFKY